MYVYLYKIMDNDEEQFSFGRQSIFRLFKAMMAVEIEISSI